jgi:hypothetical protein
MTQIYKMISPVILMTSSVQNADQQSGRVSMSKPAIVGTKTGRCVILSLSVRSSAALAMLYGLTTRAALVPMVANVKITSVEGQILPLYVRVYLRWRFMRGNVWTVGLSTLLKGKREQVGDQGSDSS